MFRRYIVRIKQAGTLHQHFTITDTHNGNLTVDVYHREANARRRVELLNSQETGGHSTWSVPEREASSGE
ncbi:hypothetical protein F0A16_01755 [Salinicola corii]|uniref:Uncharacterized protein n=1 Tax=Salinicola corii TaxID=2606937 RepID=A0A640WIR9_9GAMM|nr:hypothetical protein [Salinicola corii]KAA0020546.1 hypothetical protein F0A16_01755 [Salinicola corii]